MTLIPLQQADPAALAALLIDCVAEGASIGWVHPPSQPSAQAFWRRCQDAAERGERRGWACLNAEQGLVGSVQLQLDMPENGAQRAEICKLMVAPHARRQGLARRLLAVAEAAAIAQGRRLLLLDTLRASPAEALYRSAGYQVCGHIPGYALSAAGVAEATQVMFKRLGPQGQWVQPSAPDSAEALGLQQELSALLLQRYGSAGTLDLARWPTDGVFAIARSAEGEAEGCAALLPLADQAGVGEIRRMHARQPGRGTGGRLLAYLEHEAWTRGLRRLRLETRRANDSALAFYAAKGWQPGAAYAPYLGRPESVCLYKALG